MKTRIRDIRRQELVRAAYAVVTEYGLAGATIARISQRVEMSPGIVQYYFSNKKSLIEAAMRYSNALLRLKAIEFLEQSHTPTERLDAILRANFDAHIFNPQTAQAWLQFCSQVSAEPSFMRVQTALQNRLQSNLVHELKHFSSCAEALTKARQVMFIIDGLWVRCGTSSLPLTSEDALSIARDFVSRITDNKAATHSCL